MAIPDYQSLMLPVLSASANGEVAIRDVVNFLAEQLGLTPEERAEWNPAKNRTIFSSRVNWAKFFLGKAGLTENTRWGYFKIAPRGKQVLASRPPRIDNAFLGQFPEFRQASIRQDPVLPPVESEISTPDEIMRAMQKEIEAKLARELLERIQAAPPDFFERLVVKLLAKIFGSGADAGRAIGRAGDNGVDGVIDQDEVGLEQIYIQARRYAIGNNIGADAIRDFFGALNLHKATKGIFVTTSAFSPLARRTAELLSRRIVLIDGEQLTKLMIRHDIGCRHEETFHVKKIDEDFFE
jgi:restriction system protein